MDEIVDVVDEEGVKLGLATRRQVHSSGVWHRGIHILVFNSRGQLLIQRRSAKKNTAPGALDLSVSEHVKQGETYDQGAKRGMREELGVEGIPLKRVLKFRMAYGPSDNMVSVLYFAKFDGEVNLDPLEVGEVMPMEVEKVRRMVGGGSRGVAPWARQLLRWYLGLSTSVEEIR